MHLEAKSLDDYIEVFERDHLSGSRRDLRSYLPDRSDDLYLPVLRELVRIDLELGWEARRPRRLQEYQFEFPELFADPQSLQEVAFEEFRLRRQAGDKPTPEEYSQRFGVRTDGWIAPQFDSFEAELASVRLESAARSFREFRLASDNEASLCLQNWDPPAEVGAEVARLFRGLHQADQHLANRIADGLATMPQSGEEFAGFHLLTELGRGAFGRVFLARQAALADRPVALKIAPDVGGESQMLAQLQHTHIVPIYSIHRAGALQAVCMPYQGSVTVADLTRQLRSMENLPLHGDALFQMLEQYRRGSKPRSLGPSPVRERLAEMDYCSAVLWLGGRLADGLAHAHERSIFHRDIKPANLLLSDEGLPMLLDFNVAEDVKNQTVAAAMLGGTLPYMAPEHLRAFQQGQGQIDGRADVYSLGIVLFELLTGRFPFPVHRLSSDTPQAMDELVTATLRDRSSVPPCPRTFNPRISPATAAIVRHCLQPDPQQRYQSARQLQEDIERHLRHEPLRHLSEPSLVERGRKWVTRNPKLLLRLSLVGLLLLTVAVTWFAYYWSHQSLVRQARENRDAFTPLYNRAQFLLLANFASEEDRARGIEAARQALGLYRVLHDDDWQHRPVMQVMNSEERQQLLAEQGELLLLLANRSDNTSEALALNSRAERCFTSEIPFLLWIQRARLLEKSDPTEAERCRKLIPQSISDSPRELYLRGHELLRERKYRAVQELLRPVVEARPDSYAAQFLLALAFEGTGNEASACRCYTACIALEPKFFAPYAARGLSYLRQRSLAEALTDLDRAVELEPDRAETYFSRAQVFQALRDETGKPRAREALADLETAQKKGFVGTRIYFQLARVKRLLGDEAGANAEFQRGLQTTPNDARSWDSRGFARMQRDPQGALRDFDEALKLDPTMQNALMNKAHVLAEILHRPNEARTVLERAISAYPEYAPALAGQAVILGRLKQRDEALDRIEQALRYDKSGETLYQAGCVYALTSQVEPDDANAAIFYLRTALETRFGLEYLDDDPDLNPIRTRAEFARLKRLAEELRHQVPPPRPRDRMR